MKAHLVVGMIHTVPALAGTFEDLVQAGAPGALVLHVADPWLLRTAIESGVGDAVRQRVAAHAAHLAAQGAQAVLVTCSSIGETVVDAAAVAGIPVLRVDAPMATAAVELATAHGASGRIAVLATLESSVGPTGRLVAEAVGRAGANVAVQPSVVPGAADARAASDHAGHDAAVRRAVHDAARRSDVVVLAQASMAGALDGAELPVPVLTSPAGGVQALLERVRAR